MRGGSAVVFRMRLRVGDIIAVAGVVLSAILISVLPHLAPLIGAGDDNACIGDNCLEVQTPSGVYLYSLAEDGRYDISSCGYSLVIAVADGAARIESSDCRCGICTVHEPIKEDGESVICLPAEVVLRIRAKKYGGAVDGEAG